MSRVRSPCILVIEDERIWVDKLRRVVQGAFAETFAPQILVAENPEEADRILSDCRVDLAICDIFFTNDSRRRLGPYVRSIMQSPVMVALTRLQVPVVVTSAHLQMDIATELVSALRLVGLFHKNDILDDDALVTMRAALQKALPWAAPGRGEGRARTVINWLHISDLHHKRTIKGDGDRSVVEEAFLRDIEQQVDRGLMLDMVFITGDIAFSGRSDEYDEARDFLSRLLKVAGIHPDRVYVVPGNHDMNRGAIDATLERMGTFGNRSELAVALGSDGLTSMLTLPFEPYRKFAEIVVSTVPIDKDLSFATVLPEARVGVVGLNSALGCGITRSSRGEWLDKGKLFIGEARLTHLLDKVAASDFRIVIMHHPLSYLYDFDEADVRTMLLGKCDLLIHGHLHKSEFQGLQDVRGSLALVPGGSLYDARMLVNSYNVGSLDTENRVVEVRYRRYSDVQRAFVRDLDTTGEELDGCIRRVLPARDEQFGS